MGGAAAGGAAAQVGSSQARLSACFVAIQLPMLLWSLQLPDFQSALVAIYSLAALTSSLIR